MNTRLSPIAASLLLAFSSCVLADEATLGSVLVTATRSPMLLEHATGEVAVVTRKEIEARNVNRLTDAINTLPGVFASTGKGMLQPSPGLALRGIPDDRRTLVLIDGIPLSDGFSGSALLGGIPVNGIAQAEVLYGPMSSLYGGNAMGGVINFVTVMPNAPEFGFSVGYGDPFESGKAPAAVKKSALYAGTRFDNDLAVRVSANWAATDGYRGDWVVGATAPPSTTGARPISMANGKPGFLLGKKGENDWQEDNVSIKLEQRLSDGSSWRLGWMLQEYDFDYGTPETYLTRTTAPVGQPTFGVTAAAQQPFAGNAGAYSRQLFHAGFDTDLGGGRLNVLASYSDVGTNYSVTPLAGATSGAGRITDSPSQSLTLDSYWNAALGQHDLTTGVAYREDRADSQEHVLPDWSKPSAKTTLYSQAAGRTQLLAGYLQDNWQVMPDWVVQAGLRYDHWSNDDGHGLDPSGAKTYAARSESAWSPKLGAAFRASETLRFRASAGSAFRAPSIYDLYRSSTFGTGASAYRTLANPDLKPETVRTWELGADWKPWSGGEFKLTYFWNDISDLIYLGPKIGVAPNATRSRINAGKAESDGVTVSLMHRFDADNRVFANLTYTHSEIKENRASAASVGKQLTFMPERQAAIGFERRVGAWLTAVSGRYASKQYATDDNSDVASGVPQVYDAYFVADAKVTYRFDKNVALSLSIDNLLDRQYFSYYAAPGRSWFAELSYRY